MFEGKQITKIDHEIDRLKKRITGLEDLKVSAEVFDRFTLLTLYELSNKGYIDVLYGTIKTGKESNVFLAKDQTGRNVAVKIHRIVTSDFKAMNKYIEGDYRFKNIKKTRRSTILTWVEKEYKNLEIAFEAGVRVPEPIVSKNDVVIMDFIGEDQIAAPMLKDSAIDRNTVYKDLIENVKKLFAADLIHGDLSEYNILIHKDSPYIIDISQGVPKSHPMAEELLERDVRNIARVFGKKFDKVYERIVS